jgi:glycosyltransferase involved in cell wall biosynthesis
VKEIDTWAALFEEVAVVGLQGTGLPDADAICYGEPNVSVILIGEYSRRQGFRGRVNLAMEFPLWMARGIGVLRADDVVMARGPDATGFVGGILSAFSRRCHFAKYADQWARYAAEPLGFRLQKWFYRSGAFHGPVLVYAATDPQRPHLVPMVTASLSRSEWEEAEKAMDNRGLPPPWCVLFVGRLEKAKGVDLLIDAIADIHEMGHQVHLDIVGEGPERGSLAARASARGLIDTVTFHGWVGKDALRERYSAANLFIHPSRLEGFGKVLIEAMAYALPIIGTDVGVSRELLSPPLYGLLVPPGRADSIREAILECIRSPSAAARMGGNARVRSESFLLEGLKVRLGDFLAEKLPVLRRYAVPPARDSLGGIDVHSEGAEEE